MQTFFLRLRLSLAALLLAGCVATPQTSFVGVMIDNHEDARAFQIGLEKAPLVEEQFVEGYITRFLAFFDVQDLPDKIGPVRSVRPYFIDGSSPVLSAIFHVGGSPEALEKFNTHPSPVSINALNGYDSTFTYYETAPAPHNRFLTRSTILSLLPATELTTLPFVFSKNFLPDASARKIAINYYSPLHNVAYTYDPSTQTYHAPHRSSPKNILIIETPVDLIGPLGRLKVQMQGSGSAILFRDGGMQRGTWSKNGPDSFFSFPFSFAEGQIWMIVLDSLDRVTVQ